jgi:hypothetical protein
MPIFDFQSLFAFCDLHASRIWRTNPRVRRRALGCYDRQGFPIPQAPPWPGWWQRFLDRTASEERIVAEDALPDGSVLSTVWTGIDWARHGPPLIFETSRMSRTKTFKSTTGKLEHYSSVLPVPDPTHRTGWRPAFLGWASEEEALAKHHEILRRLRERLGH